MESAQFKTMRETLGYTSQDVADAMSVNERTARRWEITVQPPADAVAWMQDQWDRTVQEVASAVEYNTRKMAVSDESSTRVQLSRYISQGHAARAGEGYSVRRHAAIVGLIAFALSLEGRDWEIAYKPRESA